MSSKNRNQRRGLTVSDGTVLGGAIGELFGSPIQSGSGTAQLEYMYTRILFRLSMARFEWTGLPDSVSRRWMEMCLATQGLAVFFQDPDTDQFFATQGTPAGNYNMVGDPTEFRATAANNMKWWEFDIENCVPIWANDMRTPDMDIIRIYAHTLAEADRTIQINLKNARQPKILAFQENLGLTVENFLRQVESGSNAIKIDADFASELDKAIQVLDMGMDPALLLDVPIAKSRIWADAMTFLGINIAPNSDKKERLVAAEVSGNDDVIEMVRESNLISRQLACEQINAMWPELNLSVEYASDMNQTAMKDTGQPTADQNKEVEA